MQKSSQSKIRRSLRYLGMPLNLGDSDLSTRVKLLGFWVSTTSQTTEVPKAKIDEMLIGLNTV